MGQIFRQFFLAQIAESATELVFLMYDFLFPIHKPFESRPIMSNQRVQLKNLINFRPQGFVDEDIVAFYEKMKTDFNLDMVEW